MTYILDVCESTIFTTIVKEAGECGVSCIMCLCAIWALQKIYSCNYGILSGKVLRLGRVATSTGEFGSFKCF